MAENEYRVEWSIYLTAIDPIDAAKQAWALLDDATKNNTGASILFISNEYGEERVALDMEEVMKDERISPY